MCGRAGVDDGPSLFHIPALLHVENEISQNLRYLNAIKNSNATVFYDYYCLFFLISICCFISNIVCSCLIYYEVVHLMSYHISL